MKYIKIIVLLVGVTCIGLALYNYGDILNTCKRWQTRAIENYNQAVKDYTTGKSSENPGVPESWWTQNPWTISIYVWSTILKNWIMTILGIGSFTYNSYSYIRKRKYRTLLKRGTGMVTNTE
jgi:hypothetical protein